MKHSLQYIIENTPSNIWLIPIGPFYKNGTRRMILCKCNCGTVKNIDVAAFLSGRTISCGCYRKQNPKNILTRFRTRYIGNIKVLYDKWKNMISRCYDKRNIGYGLYGAKGVRVCHEWRHNYQNFLDWAKTNGWKPGLQLDKDILGNGLLYSPDTCCFVTPAENCMARSVVRKVFFEGKEYIASKLCKKFNVDKKVYYNRILRHGWDTLKAATTPVTYCMNEKETKAVVNWKIP